MGIRWARCGAGFCVFRAKGWGWTLGWEWVSGLEGDGLGMDICEGIFPSIWSEKKVYGWWAMSRC
ncbi:unnamed protein product [Prunus armeniaca]